MNEKFIRGFGKKNFLSSMIKASLIILGVFGLFISSNVNAVTLDNDTTSNNATVTVGEVEVPVFQVDIMWGDLTFNWKYNQATNEYVWTPNKNCEYARVDENTNFDDVNTTYYTDDTCSTEATGTYVEGTDYYEFVQLDYVEMVIDDYSINTQIVPSIKWKASDNYSYVDDKIIIRDEQCTAVHSEEYYNQLHRQLYSDAACSKEVEASGYEEGKYYAFDTKDVILDAEELPDSARYFLGAESNGETDVFHTGYHLYFSLVNTSTPEEAPTAGDTIGTITISIRAK